MKSPIFSHLPALAAFAFLLTGTRLSAQPAATGTTGTARTTGTTGTTGPGQTRASLTIHADRPGHRISPNLYGIFFEEINHAGDGGLYAEMVSNRTFEDADTPIHWSLVTSGVGTGRVALETIAPDGAFNRRVLRLDIEQAAGPGGTVGVSNDGYWGMALRQKEPYDLAFSARAAEGFSGTLTVSLETPDGKTLASAGIPALSPAFKRYRVSLTPARTVADGRLVFRAGHTGSLWLDNVSMFPRRTFKGRENGLRPDLAAMLQGLKPSFVRFPGGCWVEGDTMAFAQRWKNTINSVWTRRTQYNLWNYASTNGLGYHEYLQLCEDIGAEPLFVINVGMSHKEVVPMDKMKPYVQDALDAIEYANGPVTSKWGALRAKNGHPAPFHLRYMEIGNENGGPAYAERFPLFYDAIKAKYPYMRLVADVWGGYPKDRKVDLIDEHYYNSASFFIRNAHRYDTYDRKGPKVYVGEYAVTQGCGQGNLRAAIGEAAFMTGMERNSDIVSLASYAPLFANVNDKKWNPDMICFDGARVYGTPSYYVQRMFSTNRGDVVLPTDVQAASEEAPKPAGAIGLATWRTQVEFKDVRVMANGQTLLSGDFSDGAAAWKPQSGAWAAKDGVYRQTSEDENVRTFAGDPAWTDYTVTLKARKVSGAEGFLVIVRARNAENYVWCNFGGWNNRRHGIEQFVDGGGNELPGSVRGSIETGRWYDVRVEVAGNRIRTFLDGAPIQDAVIPSEAGEPLYVVSSRAERSGGIIVKAVNVSNRPVRTDIRLAGVRSVTPKAEATVLTSASLDDENTLDQPRRVAPVTRALSVAPRFTYTFPPHSVTVLRVKAR